MNSSIASLPFNVVSILALVFFNNPLKTSRFVLLSSTAKIFIFGISNSSLVLITSVFLSSLMFSSLEYSNPKSLVKGTVVVGA